MNHRLIAVAALLAFSTTASASDLAASVQQDYDEHLGALWDHFHRNPELSTVEFKTAARMAEELRAAGFEVTEGIGGTGVVAMLENGNGPLVMMRADMDGLPVEEKSGLPNASTARQMSPLSGEEEPVMHACGHDVHITSLVGTARQMAARKDEWSGTLMLVVQPAEERIIGARAMRDDGIWERFGTPDYALAFHVGAGAPAGKIDAPEGPTYAGADTVDIIIHGVGAHGAPVPAVRCGGRARPDRVPPRCCRGIRSRHHAPPSACNCGRRSGRATSSVGRVAPRTREQQASRRPGGCGA